MKGITLLREEVRALQGNLEQLYSQWETLIQEPLPCIGNSEQRVQLRPMIFAKALGRMALLEKLNKSIASLEASLLDKQSELAQAQDELASVSGNHAGKA
ncbi:hypothetical protein [Leptolyngbya sp. FACHB-261]|uniref:hypothetical protein n=1 Tax=Leptolyngbya sp. FACHB-261 TaxID=2692806 RepID=UPI0016825311|nr:hypothetical protein [Leptolyngbya sp. FACHB-261]MBD2100336.1 hypothetical protein [Leptolyngbya sp. FACHB-261]